MKKMLLISNRTFWPPHGGHEVELFHYCRGLHDIYGYTIDVYSFDTNDNISNKPNFINQIFLSKPISKFKKIINIITKSFFRRKKWPLQCSLYYNNSNKKRIASISQENKYDLIIVDMIRLAPYYDAIKELECKKILDIDDMLSKRYKRQLKNITNKTNIEGQYNKNLSFFSKKIMSLKFVKKMVLKLEIPRMENFENLYSKLYDNVIFVSQLESDEFNSKNEGNKAVNISLGIDYNYFSENTDSAKVQGRCAFLGNMNTSANADSLRLIAKEVLPFSKKIKELLVIGPCSDKLKAEFKNENRIVFTGPVDDIRTFAKTGEVFLAPIAYGTGIKTKILEAMAMGLPVVTNSIGAEGIWGKNNIDWLVIDDYKKMAESVDHLLSTYDLRCSMSCAGQKFVKENFEWDLVFKQFAKLNLK